MKWTVVYFDDQVLNIECFKELLGETFNFIGCHDTALFPEILEKNHPHALLLDVHMPIMDGHELYQKISQHPFYNGCPVIFISGDESDENKLKSYEGGGIDFLPRVLEMDEIIIRLQNKIKFWLQMSTKFEVGNLDLDVKVMKASIDGHDLDLTLLELRMLGHILRAHPHSLTRSELIEKVWGSTTVKPGTINTHLTNLKPKISSWDHQIKVREECVILQKKEA